VTDGRTDETDGRTHRQPWSGRAQWVRLTRVPGGDLSILNVYAPNNAAARCVLWRELVESLDKDCSWILAGDWNFVERSQDKSRNNRQTMSVKERGIFEQLTSTLEVSDPFLASNRVRFSWDNKRVVVTRTLVRLNCVYTPTELSRNIKADDYAILGDNSLSDHLPVWRNIILQEGGVRRSPYVMNSSYLKDQDAQELIRKEWLLRPNLPFFGKVRRCVQAYKRFCINKAADKRRTKELLQRQVTAATTEMQSDPLNLDCQERLA
jgi:hypothetical protein